MATRRAVVARVIFGIVLLPIVVGALVVAVVTNTDWGRERVRRFALGQVEKSVNGRVRIGHLGGSLLTGAVLSDVLVEDSAGAPFLQADTLSLHYTIRSFLAQDVILRDVRLVHPVVVLDQAPDGRWNFARIFPQDTAAATSADTANTGGGFGSTMRFEDVTIVDGSVTVRNAWSPADSLGEPERKAAIEAALAPSSRAWIVPVEGGWQRVSTVRELNAELPLIRLADPDEPAQVLEIASARMVALPFRPPAAHVRELHGRFAFTSDSVHVDDAVLELPDTRLSATAVYALDRADLRADIEADTLTLEDLQWFRTDLPDGGGTGTVGLAIGPNRMHIAARDLDLTVDGGRFAGDFDIRSGDTLRIGEATVTFADVDTRTVERLAGAAVVPVDGVGSGALRLSGSPDALDVDGHVEMRERNGRVSRVSADGIIGTADDGGIRADGLALRFEPLQSSLLRQVQPGLALRGAVTGQARVTGTTRTRLDLVAQIANDGSRVRADGGIDLYGEPTLRAMRVQLDPLRVATLESLASDLPIDGALSGDVVLDGSPAAGVQARLDIAHEGSGGTSRVDGRGSWRQGGAFDLDLNLSQLALATVGELAPAAGLHGTATGTLQARGTPVHTTFAADLAVPDSGRIVAQGEVRTRNSVLGYDVGADLTDVNAAALSTRAPETRLNGRLAVDGAGTDPARLAATLSADLVDTRVASAAADTTTLRVAVADGTARVDRAHITLASAAADFEGTLGLVEGRTGELRWSAAVEHLGDFSQYLPADTGLVPPRPVAQARRIATARMDSARVAQATEVQRAATGLPAEPTLDVDSVQPLARDSVAGSLAAEGVLRGSVKRLDAEGTAQAEGVVVAGAALSSGKATFSVRDLGTPDADLSLEASADSVRAAGFAFDSAATEVHYRGVRGRGNGTMSVDIHQDPGRDYRLASEFLLELDRREVTFSELVLRFDTVQWTAPHSGRLAWQGSGLTIDSLELVSDHGRGRFALDGHIATDAESDVSVTIEDLPLGTIAALLQDTLDATGQLSLGAQLTGTTAAPRLEGDAGLRGASLGGRPLPDVSTSFDYAGTLLRATAELSDSGRTLLTARARLPLDLALTGVEGPRLLDRPLGIEAHADSLPLESLPVFTGAVSDVRGRLRGDVVVGGTWHGPVLDGGVQLDLASLRIVPAGVFLRDIAGAVQMQGDAVTIDSLRANSGGGPIRVAGRLDVETLMRPTFDLTVEANDASILDNDTGRLTTDARLTVTGPMDSTLVEGDVRIRKGVIAIPDMGESRRVAPLDNASVRAVADSTELNDEILPAPNPLLDNLRVDLGLRVDRDTWVRSSDANVELYTPDDAEPMRVRLNVGRPGFSLDGVINADRGEYEFAGRVFDLTTGAVTFLPGESLDPLLQLNANYEVARQGREALVIQIHLTGTMSEPRVALESTAEPPLSESDLLSYLAFGRATSSVLSQDGASLTGGGNGLRAVGALAQQQLASLALGTAVDDAVSNLERKGGRAFDVFRIHPAQLPDEMAFNGAFGNFLRGTELEVGKYITTGLFVAAEGRTTTEALPGLRLEYETANGFSWQTLWESRYLPMQPSLIEERTARTSRVFGTFLYWSRRF